MDEVETIADELYAGAAKRGVKIVTANYPGNAAAVLSHPTTSVDEVLDIVQQSFTPFASIGVVPFDVDELDIDLDDDEQTPPEEILNIITDHVGESEGICMQWLSGGALIVYLVVAPWRRELDQLLEEWNAQRDAQRDDSRAALWARVTFLADQLERQPAYRAATIQQRPALGKKLLDPLLEPDEGPVMVHYVLERASRSVRENSEVVYAELTADMPALAEEVRELDAFKWARFARDRQAAVRDFLTEKSGGYAPSGRVVESVCRAAQP